MPDEIQVGDVVWFKDSLAEPDNAGLETMWVNAAPFLVKEDNGNECVYIQRLDGKPFPDSASWSFYRWRFRKDAFLTEARKACAHGK